MLLNIFAEMVIHLFRILQWIESLKYNFYIYIINITFWNYAEVCTVTLDQQNASLLNKIVVSLLQVNYYYNNNTYM